MNAMSTTPADSAAIHEVPRSTVVANRLRVALAALDLNVSAAARILGWSQSNLQRMTKGHVKLSIDQLDWIQERLGVPMTYLLGLTDDLPGLRKTDTSVRGLRPAPKPIDPAEVIFNDGTVSDLNRRSFRYKMNSPVIPFRTRAQATTAPCDKNAAILPFPVAASL